ncbi:2-oxoglutarate-dependent dioxygenase gloF-like [Asterias rubens]|uniref:2-oxoglutarate-dependent dioxygenase gloF-like n=1 Tax=Asterias rubens TaxID=7604 RepID=UPI001455D4FF|nr:2-oxoglutarate-dependent dioxygenase gloF-like [Asterias rubens]
MKVCHMIGVDLPDGDLKESFNYTSATEDNDWPTESACPGFKTTNKDFFELCVPLHNRVLEVMAHGLNIEDPLFFVKRHAQPSRACLRSLFYPSLDDVTVKDQQVRCSEHSDYGGITMLFHQVPGLERHRVFLDGTPAERSQSRQSIVFFGNPNEEAVIDCTDNSNKYPPITCRDYLDQKYSATHQ